MSRNFYYKNPSDLFVSVFKPTGLSKDEAKAAYVDLVEKLKAKYGI